MEFENLNFGVFGLVWLGYALEMVPKMLKIYTKIHQKCNGLERNQMVLKEPYTSLTLTILPVYLIKTRGKWS